jgi:hypothetical protein
MQSVRTNQHYVPQFILRGFASGRKQVFVLDKQTGRTFKTSTRNIAAQLGFYDIEVHGDTRSLDPLFTELEDATAIIVKAILEVRHLRLLTEDQRKTLALFVVSLMLRTDSRRRQYKHLNDVITDAILRRGGDPQNVEGFRPLTDEGARQEWILNLPRLALNLRPNLLDKTWVLYSAPSTEHYYSSDNPVVMHNTLNQNPFRGTLGLAVKGIEIYLPLSGSLCIGFLCPSIREMIVDGERGARHLRVPVSFKEWMQAFEEGTPLRLQPDNVVHHNSLQVINAERYVVSHSGRFALALEMLESHPELSHGPRMTTA